MREMNYWRTLERMFTGKRAMDKGLKECQRCGFCCHLKPCAMSPEDLNRLAVVKGMSPSEFFKSFCVVDKIEKVPLTVLPRRVGQSCYAGRWVPCHSTWDTDSCVFWDKAKGCTVYRNRPKSAKVSLCNDDKPPIVPPWSREALMALGWDGVQDD